MIFRVHALENLVHAGNAAQDLSWAKKATKPKTFATRSLVIEYESHRKRLSTSTNARQIERTISGRFQAAARLKIAFAVSEFTGSPPFPLLSETFHEDLTLIAK